MIVFRLTPEDVQAIISLYEKERLVEEYLTSITGNSTLWSGRKKAREIVAQCVQQRYKIRLDISSIVDAAQQRDEEQHERMVLDALQQWEEP